MCHLAIWKYTGCRHSHNLTPELLPCVKFNTNSIPCPSVSTPQAPLYHELPNQCHNCALSQFCKWCTMRPDLKRGKCDCHIPIKYDPGLDLEVLAPKNFMGKTPRRPPAYDHEQFMAENAPCHATNTLELRIAGMALRRWVAVHSHGHPRKRAPSPVHEAGRSKARRGLGGSGLRTNPTPQHPSSYARKTTARPAMSAAAPETKAASTPGPGAGPLKLPMRKQADDVASVDVESSCRARVTVGRHTLLPREVNTRVAATEELGKETVRERVRGMSLEDLGGVLMPFKSRGGGSDNGYARMALMEREQVMGSMRLPDEVRLLLDLLEWEREGERERDTEMGRWRIDALQLELRTPLVFLRLLSMTVSKCLRR